MFITRYPSAFRMVELRINDLRMNARAARKPLDSTVIVAIDDKSIAAIGRWPWPRERIAQLVSSLDDYGVKAIGLDLVLSEADDPEVARSASGLSATTRDPKSPPSSGDSALAGAIAKHGAVFIGTPFDIARDSLERSSQLTELVVPPSPQFGMTSYAIVRQRAGIVHDVVTARDYLPPLPIISRAARGGGFVNIQPDEDLVIRSALMVLQFRDRYFAPLSLVLVSAYLNNAPLSLDVGEDGVRQIAVGSLVVPVDESGRMAIKFRGPAGTFAQFSAVDVMDHRVPRDALVARIALVGANAVGLVDVVPTPPGDLLPGVEVHATLIDELLAGDFVHRSRNTAAEELLATILLTITIVVVVTYLPASWAGVMGLVLAGGYIEYAQYRLKTDHVLLSVVIPTLSVILIYTLLASYRYFVEGTERQHLKSLFEHYLHPDVIKEMADDPNGIRLSGQRRHLAILFADVVNFTARAERMEPEALVDLLDVYMTEMTDAILESRGLVDKLMGDGIMAFWGAPKELPNPAKSAIDCALVMLEKLDRLRKSDSRFADLDVGIGVNVGDVIVGNFGGARRFDYSIIGDAVNFASRLEALTRHFGVHLLVSRQAMEEAGGAYPARNIGFVRVKGKSSAVEVLEVAVSRDSDRDFFQRCSTLISNLHKGQLNGELVKLEALLRERPSDQVLKLWVSKLKSLPSNSGSDLVFEFDTK